MKTQSSRQDRQAGFTLLEILLVVMIIGFLVTIAVVNFAPRAAEARKVAVQDQIRNYSLALDTYQLDSGFYPSTEQGLRALIAQPSSTPAPSNWKGPYLNPPVLRQDPWGHDYLYKNPGEHNTHSFDLYSLGPNGVEGGDDDIGNWQ
jgi:general secretion pathway protein G